MPVIQMAFDTSGIRKGADEAASRLASLEKEVDALQAALRKAEAEAGRTGGALKQAFSGVGAGVNEFKGKVSGLMTALKGLGVAAAGASIVAFQKACLESAIAMDALHQSYKTIFGSAGMEAQLDVIRQQSQAVGQNFMSSAESAKTFFAAASNTSLAPQMNQIFKAVSNAGAAMHLSGEQMQGVFLALGQMVSKGKVQAEELRGQLGERLPGAFQLAAEAMGMTTAELDKFMAEGKLTAEDLLPKLADVLEHKFSDAAKEAANTVQGQLNRMMGAWEEFKANLAASGPARFVLQFITERLEGYNAAQRHAARRDDAIAYLKKSGAKPEVKGQDYSGIDSVLGASMSTEDHYSEKQIKDAQTVLDARDRALTWGKRALTQAKAQKEKRDALVKEAEAAFGKEALKSNKGKADANREKKAALARQYEGARQALVVNGGDAAALAKLEAGYKAAVASVDEQFAALEKRMAGGGGGGRKKKGGGGGGGKSAGERDAERFAENTARYEAGLERLRNEVSALDAAMKPGLTTYDRMVEKINAEKEAAVKNADVKAQEAIRRKECTAAQAEETAALEKRKAELEAQRQLDELQTQTLQDRATWYREYAELTGKANLGLDLQNQLIERQGREWEALGIPIDLVTDRIERMKLAIATDPLSGLKRGFQTLAAQAQNDAQIMEGALTTTCDMMGQAFGSFVSSGKASMTDLLNSWIATINQMVAKAAMSKIFSAIGGWFGFGAPSGGGGGVSAAASAITSAVGMLHAHGDVFAGLDGYSNSIVSRPVFFGYRRQLTAFARGAGVMGEAGPEAVMPLTRMNNGNLGVQAAGGGAGVLSVELYITDATRNGVDAEAESGELDGRQLQVVVRQVEQMMVARALNGRSPYTAFLDKSRGLSNAKSLY